MSQLTLLDDIDTRFPCPSSALTQPNGLLAVGGDLSCQRLINAYQHGIFPWYSDSDPILWWSPDPRCIIFTHKFHVSKSFRRFIKKKTYHITINQRFKEVIECCQRPRSYQRETWINDDIVAAYTRLHQQHHAHSIEVWHQQQLIGGVYGVMTDQVFCGESMFSLKPNASKLALYALSQFLFDHGVQVIDCQIPNDHLQSLGAITIPRSEFLQLLGAKPRVKLGIIDWQPRSLTYE